MLSVFTVSAFSSGVTSLDAISLIISFISDVFPLNIAISFSDKSIRLITLSAILLRILSGTILLSIKLLYTSSVTTSKTSSDATNALC